LQPYESKTAAPLFVNFMEISISRFEALVVVQLRLKEQQFCCSVEFEIQYGVEKNQEVKLRSQVVLEILHQLQSVRAVAAVQCISATKLFGK
jgi:hypothetical protein